MAVVKWDAISRYMEEIFEMSGRVERADVLDLAMADNASDDVVDALDAIGSRVFRSVADAREFLTNGGYVLKQ